MKQYLRSLLTAIALTLAFAQILHATSLLSFEGGGYWIDLEVGFTDKPQLGSVRFHAPGDSHGVVLSQHLVRVEVLDTDRRVLVLSYLGGNGVAPFTLSVHGKAAVLATGGRQIRAPFEWEM